MTVPIPIYLLVDLDSQKTSLGIYDDRSCELVFRPASIDAPRT